VARLHARVPVDLVVSLPGSGESTVCQADERFTTLELAEPTTAAILEAAGLSAGRDASRNRRGDESARIERLASLLVTDARLTAAAARTTAGLLLSGPGEADELLRSLHRIWAHAPEVFAAEAHRLLTGDSWAAQEVDADVRRLPGGLRREDLVAKLASSTAGRRHLGDLRWEDGLSALLREIAVTWLQAAWPAPAETFVAAAFDAVARRPPTRWEWLSSTGELAARASRLEVLRAAAAAEVAATGVVRVITSRAAAAEGDRRALALRAALAGSPDQLVDAIYRIVLSRDPDPRGRRELLDQLTGGRPAGAVLHDIAISDEVVDRELDTAYLLGVEGPPPPARLRWRRRIGMVGRAVDSGMWHSPRAR
jgi:hypothetical protein